MTRGEEQVRRARGLTQRARRNMARADALRAQSIQVAEEIAATEETVAGTMEELASQRPHGSDRLRALGARARERAASERQWVADHAGDPDGDHPGDG